MPYDETDLEDSEVKYLINSLKNPSNNFDIHEVQKKLTTLSEEVDSTGVVLGLVDGIEYKLHFFCGNPQSPKKRFSIHLRFAQSNIHLARVDVGSYHTNPEGIRPHRISCPHIHIYNNRYKKKDRIAMPINGNNFPNITTIIKAYQDFLDFTNTN